MMNNDVLRSVRYLLDLGDARVQEMIRLAECEVTLDEVKGFLRAEDEEGFLPCDDEVLGRFLDGLIFFRRGRAAGVPVPPLELPLTNNTILKKLRVAFQLQDEDMHEVLQSVGVYVSKPEMSALFRKEGHKNYRPCGDQWLRNFLKGLTLRVRG